MMKLTAVPLQTTPPGVSSCSRHPNAPSLVLAAFQSIPITTKHTSCSSSVFWHYVPSFYYHPNMQSLCQPVNHPPSITPYFCEQKTPFLVSPAIANTPT